MASARNTEARRAAIMTQLQQKGRVLVDDLALMFSTTPQTIRKDLNVLSEDGCVMRFHGGAALLAGTEYTGFDVRSEISRSEKEKIGAEVARHIPNNAAVIINAGTTTAAVARCLGNHAGLKIVTDSVMVANEIRGFSGAEVMVPGGVVRGSDGVILGESSVEFIKQFRSDLAIIGAAAVAKDGALLDYDLREAAVARAIIGAARHVILAVDSSKFEGAAPVCIGHLSEVSSLVSDVGCSESARQLCKTFNVDLTLVS